MSNSNGSLKLVSGCSLSDLSAISLFDGSFGVYIGGFGKTQIRVDAYFVLKKTETDWAQKRARPAGSEGPRPAGLGPFWPLSVPSSACRLFS